MSAIVACGSQAVEPRAGSSPTSSPSPSISSTPVAGGTATVVTPQPHPSGNATTKPKPTPKYSSGLVRVVSEEDSGSTIELRVGESLRVELGRDYQQPAAHLAGVLERTSATGGYPTGKDMVAIFKAVKVGTAEVRSSTDYACLRATPSCALPQQLWSVHVVVKA